MTNTWKRTSEVTPPDEKNILAYYKGDIFVTKAYIYAGRERWYNLPGLKHTPEYIERFKAEDLIDVGNLEHGYECYTLNTTDLYWMELPDPPK